MRAIEYAEHGEPSVLKYRTDIPVPAVGDTEVLVRVRYAGVNPVDAKLRKAPLPNVAVPKPKIPGADVAGEIVELGSNVVFRKGQQVYAMLPIIGTPAGGYADYVCVDQSIVSPVPANVALDGLAGMPLVGLTVLQAFDKVVGPLRGKKVLIHAGAGGLGSIAIQYAANHLGMKVATTCGPDNLDFVRELGAEIAINYREQRFEDELSGYDVIFDPIEGEYAARAQAGGVLKPDGHYLSILSGHGGLPELIGAPIWNKIKQWSGYGPQWSRIMVAPCGRDMMRLTALLESGEITPVVDRVLPMMRAIEAHQYLEQGHARGKVILDCGDPQ